MKNLSFKAFENYLTDLGYQTKTIQRKLKHINRFEKWLTTKSYQATTLDYPKAIEYIAWERSHQIAETTLRHYLNHLKNYYNFLVQKQLLQQNPFDLIPLKTKLNKKTSLQLQDLLKPKELEQILQAYQANPSVNQRDKVLLSLLIYQGIAVAELPQLKIKNLNLEQGLIQLTASKNYAARTLNLQAKQILPLAKYIEDKNPNQTLIAYQNEKQGVNARAHLCNQIRKEITKQQLQINFKNLRQIRRSVIAQWVRVHNLRQAQYLAGHHWVNSTERYQVQQIDQLIKEVNQYHPLR